MDSASPPNTQRPVRATIDIPAPSPWVELEGDADTQDYGWRQPRYHVLLSGRPFDDDFARVLIQCLPFGVHFATGPSSVMELKRLADSRQTKFEGKPLKDGSNLFGFYDNPVTDRIEVNGGDGLLEMYDYMKDVLQMLYRKDLVRIEEGIDPVTRQRTLIFNKTGMSRLIQILLHGADDAHEIQRARLSQPNHGPEYALGFEWVRAFDESVFDGVLSLQAALWWSIDHAYDPVPYMQMAIDMVPPITRLILYLLTRERSFNSILEKEHIEDLLHDKRINWFTEPDMFTMGVDQTLACVERYDANVKSILVRWQQRMRSCFDYRMLRDWGFGRHWKKIYLVCDEPPESEERTAIDMFRTWASNNNKLTYEMFGVHPMHKDEIADGDICTICYCGWEDTELVMELNCGHRFHPNCIYQHWDNPNHYSNPCANCRASNGWLKDRMDFPAEKVDVDYTTDHGAMATRDQNLDYGLRRCIEEDWPGGIAANFRPEDGHHEYYWRSKIGAMRTERRQARYAVDQALGDIDGPDLSL